MAGELRVLARSLLTARGRAGRDAVGGVALAVALAALVAEIAAWQAARGRDHQAAAARRTASGRHRARPRPPARRTVGPDAGRVGGTAGHGARHGRVEGRGGPAAGRTASPP